MTVLTILAGLLVAILGGWFLIEMYRGRRSLWLVLALPVLMAWPIAMHVYGGSLLGYATAEMLSGEFELIHSYADDRAHAVYATVRLKGAPEPRFYVVQGSAYEQARKAFAAAQAQVAKGLPIAGRQTRNGLTDEGSFVFYQLPPAGIPAKG